MDLFSKLSDYEIFGHLTQGLLLFVGLDIAFGTSLVLGASWDVPTGLSIVLAAYVAGHLIASPSSLLLERGLARGVLGGPMRHLLRGGASTWWQKVFFPGYFAPLPEEPRKKLLVSLGLDQASTPQAEAAFWAIYPTARTLPGVRERLATFLRLYGFCRNSAFVAVLVAGMLLAGSLLGQTALGHGLELDRSAAVLIAMVTGWILFLRYLKFYRAYSVELTSAHLSSLTVSPARTDKPSGQLRTTHVAEEHP